MKKGMPYDGTPEVNAFPGDPDDCFDMVNKYGTYNIQPTSAGDPLFPLIGPGLPRPWRQMKLGKDDLERQK